MKIFCNCHYCFLEGIAEIPESFVEKYKAIIRNKDITVTTPIENKKCSKCKKSLKYIYLRHVGVSGYYTLNARGEKNIHRNTYIHTICSSSAY